MDAIQLTIIIISFALTVLAIILGIQVFHILKEMKFSLMKFNKMLDDMGKVSGTISNSFSGISGIFSGLKAGLSFFSGFRKKKDDEEEK